MNDNDKPKLKKEYTVLPSCMGGGPKGLGDPDDKTLRTIESDILVHQFMREKSEVLCMDKRKALTQCLNTCTNSLMVVKCRQQTRDLRMCQFNWFQDENFKKQVTDEYLEMRSEYRRTGVTKQDKERVKRKEEQFVEWQKKKSEEAQ